MISFGQVLFQLAYQASPIILTNGIATYMPGGMLPVVVLTQSIAFAFGLLSGGDIGIDEYWANFMPMPGTTLVEQRFGKYPFANQAVAANAVIADPLHVSMLMLVPASDAGGYLTKLAVMQALTATIKQHNASGGTYTVLTPSYYYTNCLLQNIRDVSPQMSKQPQTAWQWDFEQPLLTLQDAIAAQNSLMSKLTNGLPMIGQDPAGWSSQATVGDPSSMAGAAVSPSVAASPGAIVSSPIPPITSPSVGSS